MIFLISCQPKMGSENGGKVAVNSLNSNSSLINKKLEFIKLYKDSVNTVYKNAIIALRSDTAKEIVRKKYELKAAKFYQLISSQIDEITKLYTSREISQPEYDYFVDQLSFDQVKKNKSELENLGMKFDLTIQARKDILLNKEPRKNN